MTTASVFSEGAEVRLTSQPNNRVLVRLESPGPGRLNATSVPAADLRAALDEIAPVQETWDDEDLWAHNVLQPSPQRKAAMRQRDDALAMAALWKETARELAVRVRTAKGYMDALTDAFDRNNARAEQELSRLHTVLGTTTRQRDDADEHLSRAKEELAALEGALEHPVLEGIEGSPLPYRDALNARLNELMSAEQPRPLTPDDITYEMVERGRMWLWESTGYGYAYTTVRDTLVAALTEPTRPEGAEAWEDELDGMPAADELSRKQRARLADALAERDHALRMTGAES